MKRIGLLVVIVFCGQLVFSQVVGDSAKVEGLRSFFKIKVSWDAGFEWEQKIDKKSVLAMFGGIGIGGATDDFTDTKAPLIVVPVTYIEYRNYYNLDVRATNQRKTHNNSANFLFSKIETYYPIAKNGIDQNYFGLLFMEGWGAQRMLGKKISIDFHFGIIEHIYYDKPPSGGFNYVKLEPLLSCAFSYLFQSNH